MKPPYPRRVVTQADVSADCGLSEMTVSRVLRGQAGVSARNAEKVRESARKLGYVANRIAGALAGAPVPLVAVIVPSLSNMVFPEVLMGLAEGFEGTPLQSVLGLSNYSPVTEERVLAELLAWRPAAVVLTGLDHSATTHDLLARANVPVVEIMDSDGTGIDCLVGLSQRAAGAGMAQAVIAAGYRNVVLLRSNQQADRRQDSRFAGFCDGLQAAGVPVLGSVCYRGASSVPKGRTLAAEALERWPEAEFLYFTNDMIAAGALFALEAAGRNVPEDIGLAGFSGLELLAGLTRRVATTDVQRFEIGRQAARMIVERLAGAEPGLRHELRPVVDPGDTLRRQPVSPAINRVGTTVTS